MALRCDSERILSHRDSACTGKIRFPSKNQAKAQKKYLMKKVFCGKPNNLRAYRCPYCSGFHLGNNDNDMPLIDLDQLLAWC